MRVLKFGGTSVANATNLKLVAEIITNQHKAGDPIIAVVSAFSGITDLLLRMVDAAQNSDKSYLADFLEFTTKTKTVASDLLSDNQYNLIVGELEQNHEKLKNLLAGVYLIQEASPKSKDFVVSFGERNCAFILSHYLRDLGHDANYLDARDYIKTDSSFGSAVVDFDLTNSIIKEKLGNTKNIIIATGFIGSDKRSGVTTTLGRGGSDYSASIFAAALDASVLEIWTDVDGVLTSDPRKVTKAYSIPKLSYLEAAEMSHFGAKVLYAPTIKPVKDKSIPTYIKNTFNPDHPGTLIHKGTDENQKFISGISSINSVALISLEGSGMQGVPGMAYRFFKCIADGKINVIMITQASSEHSICIAVSNNDTGRAKEKIEAEFDIELQRKVINPLAITNDLCLLAIIGANMKNSPGVAGKLFHTLGKNEINIEAIAQGSSELNITFAISEKDESRALNSIHDSFFLSKYKTIHLYIVGVGLIGSTLIKQILNNKKNILEESHIELSVCGLSNSRKMVFADDGLDINEYSNLLSKSEEPSGIENFIEHVIADKHINKIFVDNTASKIIPEYYARLLSNNIAISTPNKIALSSGLHQYKKLKELSFSMNVPLNFETNVGAGLPVISTLKSLTTSGDKIHKIEATLSGSVSYIFNNFSSKENFHDIVLKAKEMGLTEPDPREDLSGADVKRKLLILSRECGFNIEGSAISIKDILSEDCLVATSVESFFSLLEKDQQRFKEMIVKAESQNKRLRFIATYENGEGRIGLQEVDNTNPFYSLSGSDNMIVISSERYSSTPLVIRGPGAGAEVTAAGILAEIISIGKHL